MITDNRKIIWKGRFNSYKCNMKQLQRRMEIILIMNEQPKTYQSQVVQYLEYNKILPQVRAF